MNGKTADCGVCACAHYGADAVPIQEDGSFIKETSPTAGEILEEIPLSQSSPRDAVWDKHRAASDIIRAIYFSGGSEFERYAQRIGGCSGRLFFGWSGLVLVLVRAFFCRVRHCVICQWRRSLMWKARFYSALPKILQVDEYKNCRFLLLTLTVKNCHITELSDTIDSMNAGWRRLMKNRTLERLIVGFVRSTEVTRGKDFDMNAHPHFHAILMVPSSYFGGNYIKQSEWIELWRNAARLDYAPSVNIQAIKWATGATEEQKIASLNHAVMEVLKYSVKPEDMIGNIEKGDGGEEWFLELTRQLHKKRFIATGGALKNILRENDESDEGLLLQENGESQPLEGEIAMAFDWQKPRKKYIRNRAADRAFPPKNIS